MIQVYKNLFVGNEAHCNWRPSSEWAIIHACKHPCHRHAVGYNGNLQASHPNYLIYQSENHLVLNMVDMERELSALYTDPIMKAAMGFIEGNINRRNVLVHCNQGVSRSPSIALLYMARVGHISNQSYSNAADEFRVVYPGYDPGAGIAIYMGKRWDILLTL